MPNPLAHPAASIPFVKKGLIFSALVMGSLSPDFGYFIRVNTPFYMYSLPGLFLFDLPVGFLLLVLFQTFAKWPLLSLLPKSWQRKLYKHAQGFTYGPIKRFGLILLSVVVGSITHILWDSFTHDYGWMVEHVAFLSRPVAGIPLYDILQNLSTLVGIALLIFWFVGWIRTAPEGEQLPARFSLKVQGLFGGLAFLTIGLVEGSIFYARLHSVNHFFRSRLWFMGSITFSAIFVLFLFAGIYCLAWMIAFQKTVRKTDQKV